MIWNFKLVSVEVVNELDAVAIVGCVDWVPLSSAAKSCPESHKSSPPVAQGVPGVPEEEAE